MVYIIIYINDRENNWNLIDIICVQFGFNIIFFY